MLDFSSFLAGSAWFFAIIALLGSVYQLLAAYAVKHFTAQAADAPRRRPPVSLIKPLCGDEPHLYENLRSFCELDYPEVQIVFGVRDRDDPAAGIVRRLQSDLPKADIALVADPRIYGTNYKVSNIVNMMPAIKHDTLVLSDSDMHVEPHYLDPIVGGLERPGNGLVTCLYVGRPTAGAWSKIGAAGINFWFLPSALVSKLLGGKTGCYGATIALKRATLDAAGGFVALKDQLADDYALGALVQENGLEVSVVPYFLDTTVHEPDFTTLFRHELRWARTIRNTAPIGYAGSAITHPIPMALLGLGFGSVAGLPWPMLIMPLAMAGLCRLVLVRCVLDALAAPRPAWWLLVPRDVLSLVVLVLAFCGRSVSWRESAFRVDSAGALSTKTDGI